MVPVACNLLTSDATLPLPGGNVHFLVVTREGDPESSLGRDSFGRERPPSAIPCR